MYNVIIYNEATGCFCFFNYCYKFNKFINAINVINVINVISNFCAIMQKRDKTAGSGELKRTF